MPTYQYECPECGEIKELYRRIKERNHTVLCPKCDLVKMKMMISAPSVQIWKPLFLEHVSHEGKWFNSKSELRRYCRKNKIASSALL